MSTIRINEATFKRIIAESVRGVLNEISPELKAAAAMTAMNKAEKARRNGDTNKYYKYFNQGRSLGNAAADQYNSENPGNLNQYQFDANTASVTGYFDPENNPHSVGSDKTVSYYPDAPVKANRLQGNGIHYGGTDAQGKDYYKGEAEYYNNLDDRQKNRYTNWKNNINNLQNKAQTYQANLRNKANQ